jgi:hypothetical protein
MMNQMPNSRETFQQSQTETTLLLILSGVALLLHCLANAFTAYGYFRDELYYIACSNHPAFGYVDQPPLSIAVLTASRFLIGDSLFAIRLPAALAASATVLIAGMTARELGGGLIAQGLAAIAVIVSPVYLSMSTFYSMNCIDVLIWTGTAYALTRLIVTDRPRYWIIIGILLGLGLLNKISVLWLGAGVAAGILFSPQRRWFRTRWPWIAAGIALLLFSPYVVWNIQHDFAHLEFVRNATSRKYGGLSSGQFLFGQFLQNQPMALPLWIAGLVFYFRHRHNTFRPVGFVYAIPLVILLVNGHSKPEYLSPAYATLFAGGAVLAEQFAVTAARRRVLLLYVPLLIVSGAVSAPLAMPLLPVNSYIRYAAVLGMRPNTAEGKKLGDLPQFYADMFGWKDKAEAVAKVYNSLSPEDKAKCAIYANNYGRCAAIDFFGEKEGLPKSIGNHNNYWLWGHGQYKGGLVIILGDDPEELKRSFDSVFIADTVSSPHCMPYENNLPITICRNLKEPIDSVWAHIKSYI